VVAGVEQPSTRVEQAALLGKRMPEEISKEGSPNADKAGKQRDVLCVLCSVVLVLCSYNLLYSNRDCPSSNSHSTVKNPVSLTPSEDPLLPP